MKIKIDENLPAEAAGILRNAGHDAVTVVEQHLAGAADPDIASICQQEERALITLDVGFADLRTYPPDQYPGLVVLRLRWHSKSHVLQVLQRLIPMLSHQTPERHLWIVEETQVRIRS